MLLSQTEYQACMDYDEKQAEYLKALDFMDILTGWRFYCEVDWSVLEKEDMKEKYSTQVDNWPKVGCGAKFLPWGRGASMVMAMQMNDGSWEAFMAD
eukprot:12893897-Prorocentrum_lima.AAC.1